MKHILSIAAGSLLGLCSHAQNLVVNGSFETPLIPIANYAAIPTNQLAPWDTDGANLEIWSDGMTVDGSLPTYSVHGRQNLEIQGGGTSVWQTVSTVVGEDYQLSFYHSPRATFHTTLTVSIDGQVIATFDEDGSALSDFSWQRFKTNFTATASATTIRFADSPPIGGGTHIDNVVLERLPLRSTLRVTEVELCWETVANKSYQAQYRSQLTRDAWVNLGAPRAGSGTTSCIRDTAPSAEPQRIYQVITVP